MTYLNGMFTNRSFLEVDRRFIRKLGDEILQRSQNKNCTILDAGCGTKAEALMDITSSNPYLKGIGIDYYFEKSIEISKRVKLIKADLFYIPLQPVIDVAYTTHVIANISSYNTKIENKLIAKAIISISKTLKQKGIAFIDEAIFTSTDYNLEYLKEILEEQHSGFNNDFKTARNPSLGLHGNYLTVQRI